MKKDFHVKHAYLFYPQVNAKNQNALLMKGMMARAFITEKLSEINDGKRLN